ncbi:MAG: serine/threonine protein kinase [Polyangiaceae bacterium]|nr:serine/threonine protein kinase [Polyangiaceae bacterium]
MPDAPGFETSSPSDTWPDLPEETMLATPATGLIIAGKYKLLECIGSGGMSEVYRAENLVLRSEVALKLLHPGHVGDRSLTARFFQEAQSIARIRHPGIVSILDAGDGETGPYLVMEYLKGESAAAALSRERRFAAALAIATLTPVLDALHAAHATGVVHRDLKPENVFFHVDSAGTVCVKLLDFGIAKLLAPTGPTPRTSTGVVFGTPDYLSPEQAAGEPNIDARSDLFSVGVMLYELLTGVRPFHAPTTVATAYRIAHARTPRLSDNGGPSDPTLEAVLQRALAKRPEERHGSAAELAAELAAVVPPAQQAAALSALIRSARPEWSSGIRPRAPHVPERTLRSSATDEVRERRRVSSSATPMPSRPSGTTRRSRYEPESPTGDADSGRDTRPRAAAGASGRFVRGVVLRAIDEYVKLNFIASERDRILDEVGRQRCPDLELGTVQAIVQYDLQILQKYVAFVTRELGRGQPSWARTAGERSVASELAPVLRHAASSPDQTTSLRRAVPLLARLFEFASWQLEFEPNGITLEISGVEGVAHELRLWIVGTLEGILRAQNADGGVEILRGEAAFAPQLVVGIARRD